MGWHTCTHAWHVLMYVVCTLEHVRHVGACVSIMHVGLQHMTKFMMQDLIFRHATKY